MFKFLSSAVLICLCVFVFSACVKFDNPTPRADIFLDDGKSGKNADQVTIDESSLKAAEIEAAIKRDSYQETGKTVGDGSKISTMYDGFGNKTERRFFNQHSLLQAMVLRTSSGGQKEILIFGHNGEVKTVPPHMLDRAMTATADELAKAAGILHGRKPVADPFPGFGEPNAEPDSPTFAAGNLPDAQRNKVEKEITEREERSKIPETKNDSQNIKQAELQYRSEINRLNLKAKKNQTAKNSEAAGENR